MCLPVVLHPDVVQFLRTMNAVDLNQQVWHCIDKLRLGQFDTGLRVKKLRGIAKRLWEARINQASRLLFTYTQSRSNDPQEDLVYIAIQDICVDHNDVTRNAQRRARKRTPDSDWLYADLIESQEIEEGNNLSYQKIEAHRSEELKATFNITDQLDYNIEWGLVENQASWEKAIINQDADLPLKLTPKEYQLVRLYGHLLLSGSAGTGKTTVALYKLLNSIEMLPVGKRLYIAYNPILVKESEKKFSRLLKITHIKSQFGFEFKTIRDLCLALLKSIGKCYHPSKEVTYQVFVHLYNQQYNQTYPPALVWNEIVSIIKGAALSTHHKLLSETEYLELGKNRSSVFKKNQRQELYKIAIWYQNLLEREGRFDEIDLAKEVLKSKDRINIPNYQFIACDEVQDMTELQLHLIVNLIAPSGHLFFAGDIYQMINPSGFRWEDLKSRFFQTGYKVVFDNLNINFRNVGSLVNLANQVIRLRHRLLQNPDDQKPELGNHYGESARLISASRALLSATLNQLHPDEAILVRTETDKQILSQTLKTTFIFTIEEAKGLEFDTVFLFDFFIYHHNLWNRILNNTIIPEEDKPELKLELNLLYVAITRARRILNIWETQTSPFWNQPELVSFLQKIDHQIVRNQRLEPTPEQWRKQGKYFLELGYYSQAIECFQKSNDEHLQWEALAKQSLQQQEYDQAAQIYELLEDWEEAAKLYEKCHNCEKANQCWQKTSSIIDDFKLGLLALKEQKYDLAINYFNLTLLHQPNNLTAYNNRGTAYYGLGEHQKAIADYTNIIQHNPHYPNIYYNRALAYIKLSNYDLALADYNQALTYDPNYDELYYRRSLIKIKLQDYIGAIQDLNECLKLNPNHQLANDKKNRLEYYYFQKFR